MAEGNGRSWSADIKGIGDQIAALTVSKAVELGDYLEQVHKIKPAAGGGGVMVTVNVPSALVEEVYVPLTGEVLSAGMSWM